MKKIFQSLVLIWIAGVFSAVFAAESHGVRATVELVTGTKQTAQFLGVENDTVSLGGSIKGKFTVVRIPANRFKSILDEQGNSLLPAKESSESKKDTLQAKPDTAAAVAKATSAPDTLAKPDTTAQEPLTGDTLQQAEETPREPSPLDTVEGKHVYVALESRSSDAAIAEQFDQLIIKLIKESGTPISIMKHTEIEGCSRANCVKDTLKAHGAASVYIGRITAARTPDSLSVQAQHYLFSDSTASKSGIAAKMNLSAMHSLSDAMSHDKFRNFIATLQGEKVTNRVVQGNKSYVHIDTDPDGASIVVHGQNDICKSPCTFTTTDTGKIVLYAYWIVNHQLWSAKSTIKPIPSDTAKVSLKLKKVKPELRINTIPEGAEIFAGSSPITKGTSSIGKSPNHYPIYEPGFATIQIRKAGFRDTVLTVFAAPTEITNVSVQLAPITSFQEQATQEEWLRERKKSFIGKTLMGSSIAPFVLGALFTYLAHVDYDDADHIKNELDHPAAGGENYQARVKENRDLVDKGDRKMIIGGSLLGAGVLLLGVGFVLTF